MQDDDVTPQALRTGRTVRLPAAGEPDDPAAVPVPGGWLLPAGPITIAHGGDAVEVHRHGWTSWSPTGWTPIDEAPLRISGDPDRTVTADDAANDAPDRHEGNGAVAVALADGRVVLLGALGLGVPRAGADAGTLWGRTETPGGPWFVGTGDEDAVFAAYAAQLAEHFGTSADAGSVSTVWCSWYSFFEDIDAERIEQSVDALGSLPFDVVQVDDGWEEMVGDWTPNDRFPDGLVPIAERIAARGARPGLWLAPFICLPDSRTAREHPDWLVQREDGGGPIVAGHNWDTHYWALDTTLPAVRDHLTAVFRSVVDWGFRYCKLDFLSAAALRGVRHRDGDREAVYRDAIQLVRDVVGPDVHLLGCGAPMLPSIGVLDAMRAGPDTASFWASAATVPDPSHEGGLNGLVGPLERVWMNPLYRIDPDVVSFHDGDDTLAPDQRALLADLARVCGFRSTSDPVQQLAPAERAGLADFLGREPRVRRLARYRFEVDGRVVDFGPAVAEARIGRESLGR
ncbi:glycoside hydrolase family 36 protein [Curtobacterium sp. MCBA15_008]|uniref:glycoside hydrolase family 36 protein n=1 Tax=Curtobacterium sp. MCBA15_008 TaxID=1898736 RepID=UPI0011134B18|nr:glycoside hydrolase family 36 protein [Curtobacterium sp. MCBA15_008]